MFGPAMTSMIHRRSDWRNLENSDLFMSNSPLKLVKELKWTYLRNVDASVRCCTACSPSGRETASGHASHRRFPCEHSAVGFAGRSFIRLHRRDEQRA